MKKLLFALIACFVAVQFAFAAVNINTATQAELEKLQGIGPAKAKAIVEDRKKNGPFKTTDDLKRVKGIGDKNFEALKSEITVGGPAAAPKADAKAAAAPAAAAKPAAAPAPAAKPAAPAEAKKDDAKKDAKK
ncbi:MAG: ComEA family DNA-binding protein [Rhodocyclaceae bacterium]|nr:MAG: ComEA family DNA-binding protein [Rhodocyclaceae bacterium]